MVDERGPWTNQKDAIHKGSAADRDRPGCGRLMGEYLHWSTYWLTAAYFIMMTSVVSTCENGQHVHFKNHLSLQSGSNRTL